MQRENMFAFPQGKKMSGISVIQGTQSNTHIIITWSNSQLCRGVLGNILFLSVPGSTCHHVSESVVAQGPRALQDLVITARAAAFGSAQAQSSRHSSVGAMANIRVCLMPDQLLERAKGFFRGNWACKKSHSDMCPPLSGIGRLFRNPEGGEGEFLKSL